MENNVAKEVIKFKRLYPDAQVPIRGTPYSVGFDLFAQEEVVIKYGEGSVLVGTGIAVELPAGTYGRVAARSGRAYRDHLAVNAGVVDPDYRGEVGVILYMTKNNHSCVIKKGERIAQLIIERVSFAEPVVVDNLTPVENLHVGYGSTGNN